MNSHIRLVCTLAFCCLHAAAAPVFAQNYCTTANPNDNTPDDVPLQQCLDGGGLILLSAGSPGYILFDGLRLNVDGTVLSADPGNRATLIAHADLDGPMIRAFAVNYEISFLIFDGNRHNRTVSCAYPNGQNIQALGGGFVIRFIDSNNARCGSALEVTGSDYSIYNSTFAWNGFSAEERQGEWADGLTLHRCTNSSVTNNQIAENTDVGLVVNEGLGCTIRWNTFWNYERRAFAGMHVSAAAFSGSHSGSDYSNNSIDSGYDRMEYGLIIGAHQWFPDLRTPDVGSITWNSISGGVVNLAVDGVDGGVVMNNSASGAQGTRGPGTCYGLPAENYIAAHNGPGVTIQSGWVARACHN